MRYVCGARGVTGRRRALFCFLNVHERGRGDFWEAVADRVRSYQARRHVFFVCFPESAWKRPETCLGIVARYGVSWSVKGWHSVHFLFPYSGTVARGRKQEIETLRAVTIVPLRSATLHVRGAPSPFLTSRPRSVLPLMYGTTNPFWCRCIDA